MAKRPHEEDLVPTTNKYPKVEEEQQRLLFILTPHKATEVREILSTPALSPDIHYATTYTYVIGSASKDSKLEEGLEEIMREYQPYQAHPEVVGDIPSLKLILDYLAGELNTFPSRGGFDYLGDIPRSDLGKWTMDGILDGEVIFKLKGPYKTVYIADYDPAVTAQEREELENNNDD